MALIFEFANNDFTFDMVIAYIKAMLKKIQV